MTLATPEAQRRADLAKIHIAAKELGMDRETYQAMLLNIGGKESSAELSDSSRRKVLTHLRQLGWKNKRHTRKQKDPKAKKILALWLAMHRDGIVRDNSDSALNHFIQRQTGVARIEWLKANQANQVIEALKAMRARA